MAYNKTKTDPALGLEIHNHLDKVGVETPVKQNGLSRTDKIENIERHMEQIMKTLGLDLSDDSLIDTPKRVAKMYVNEIFWGLDYEAFPKCTAVDNKMKYENMIVETNISVQSNCEQYTCTSRIKAMRELVVHHRVILMHLFRLVYGAHAKA